jgi:hypothetical protein
MDDSFGVGAPVVPRAAGGRAKKPVKYAFDDSEDDFDD